MTIIVRRQPALSEHELKSALASICDLRDNVYRCVDKTTCCKVRYTSSLIYSHDSDDDFHHHEIPSSSAISINQSINRFIQKW